MSKYILALDQGTSSSRAIVFDQDGNAVSVCQKEFTQHFPRPGWVEHDPMEIWASEYAVMTEAVATLGLGGNDIAAIGITNQRETTIVWDAATGKPLCNAIVWQDRRTSDYCDSLKASGLSDLIRSKTGLLIDAYFSGTKIRWILDNVPGAREKADRGELRFGTVDSWLVWNLTGGSVHVTDVTNASRTMLFNIHTLEWDKELLDILNIPESMMPQVRSCSEVYGLTSLLGGQVPIAGIAGDQQSALFGQMCTEPGSVKNTYGTGCFLLMNSGTTPIMSRNNLLTTIAWKIGDTVNYALEGSIFVAGSAIQWLRDELGLIRDAAETETLAHSVPDNGGVYMVSAFTGLGAPHWDMYARGAILGLTRGTTRAHLARAALEGIAYQVKDLIDAMEQDALAPLSILRVDGGASVNRFLMQFQSDILQKPIDRPRVVETTALGAAFLAGLAVGVWKDKSDVERLRESEEVFRPRMDKAEADGLCRDWERAVERSLGWETV